MELPLRILAAITALIALLFNTLLTWVVPRKKPTFPPIRNKLLTLSMGDLVTELRQRKVKKMPNFYVFYVAIKN